MNWIQRIKNAFRNPGNLLLLATSPFLVHAIRTEIANRPTNYATFGIGFIGVGLGLVVMLLAPVFRRLKMRRY
jgi:hypothetical protein